MSGKVRGLVVGLCVLLLLAGAAVALYFTGILPVFNEKVDQFLGRNEPTEEELLFARQQEELRQRTSIQGLHPYLFSVTAEKAQALKQRLSPSPAAEYSYPDEYSIGLSVLSKQGDLSNDDVLSKTSNPAAISPLNSPAISTANSPATDIPAEAVNFPQLAAADWIYSSDYPLIAPAANFYDAVVFIDAQPALVCLDRATGAELLRLPCDVYPGAEAFSHEKSYYFKSRTGNWYQIRFEPGLTPPETLGIARRVEEERTDDFLYQSLLPQKSALDFINAKMNGLLSVSPAVSVPHSLLYSPESGPLAFGRDLLSPAFVFSPQEQGTYTLGLCDEEGLWIRDNAFVVLYTMAGEAIAISLDYVADRPQITTHLSDRELYVVCAGFIPASLTMTGIDPLAGGLQTDIQPEIVVDEETGMEILRYELPPADATTDVPDDTAAIPQAWFQVKKAP